MWTTYLPSVSYFIGTLVVILHGIYFLAQRLFVTKEEFEQVKQMLSKSDLISDRLIRTLENLSIDVKENSSLTRDLSGNVCQLDKKMAVLESRIAQSGS